MWYVEALGVWIVEHITVIATAITAAATVAIFIFTRKLAQISKKQGRLTRKSIELARAEFLSSHRPKIRIKHVFLETEVWDTNLLQTRIHIVNSGNTKAILKGCQFSAIVAEDGHLPRLTNMKHITIDGDLMPGRNTDFSLPLDQAEAVQGEFNRDIIKEGKKKLFFVGGVFYTAVGAGDVKEHQHLTAFCRVLRFNDPNDPKLKGARFLPLEKPDADYEYED